MGGITVFPCKPDLDLASTFQVVGLHVPYLAENLISLACIAENNLEDCDLMWDLGIHSGHTWQ